MPFIKLLVHAVWATKDRKPLMDKANKDALCHHIREYSKGKSIHLINVNGWLDHLHCFISLAADQNIATIMNLIKGESSYWANKNLNWKEKFGWQDDYFAVSVGESQFDAVNDYISNQEEHHQRKTFQQEYDEFIKNYRIDE
jgi:REP element-mobilizing transposase RayT